MNEHTERQAPLACYAGLEPHEQQQVAQHLRACPECADTLAVYQKMDRTLHQYVDHQLRYLAAQPHAAPARSTGERCRPQAYWVERLMTPLTRRPVLALQLTGASVFILLLVMLSLFFAGWEPREQQMLASTPTVVDPTITATPTSPGVWASQLVLHEQATATATANPLAHSVGLVGARPAPAHFAQLWDPVIDQAIVLHLPRQEAAPWKIVVVTDAV